MALLDELVEPSIVDYYRNRVLRPCSSVSPRVVGHVDALSATAHDFLDGRIDCMRSHLGCWPSNRVPKGCLPVLAVDLIRDFLRLTLFLLASLPEPSFGSLCAADHGLYPVSCLR
jgi:hypothetical protein